MATLCEKLTQQFQYHPYNEQDTAEKIDSMCQKLTEYYYTNYCKKMAMIPADEWQNFEKNLLLQILDHHWKEHLVVMEDLRESIGFRGYAQTNPEHEYKIESYNLFKDMLSRISNDYIVHLIRLEVQIKRAETPEKSPTS